MKHSDYWRQRFESLEKTLDAIGQDTYFRVEPAFDDALREIDGQIEKWLNRIAVNNKLSMKDARKLLDADQLAEFHWSVEEYTKHGKENAIDQRWMKQLENASAKFHISKLEAMKLQTQQSLEKAFGNYLDGVDGMARKVYTEGYYRTAFEIQKGFGIGYGIGSIDNGKLTKLIGKPWAADGKNFSDRIWQAKTQMVNDLHKQLVRTCIMGKAPDEAIKAMMKYAKSGVKNAKSQAARLIMTEQAFFAAAATKDSYLELGVEAFEIVATLDSHTSEICRDLDGRHFPMKDYEPGVTAPPFHVYCRSTTCPYFDDEYTADEMRAARGEDGKTYYVPANMKYAEWQDSFVGTRNKLEVPLVGVTTVSSSGILNDDDLYALNEYKSSKSYILNEMLRNYMQLDEEWESLKKSIDAVLSKLPKYEGTVFRSLDSSRINDLEAFWTRYAPGEIVPENAYTSASTSVYDESMEIQMIIESKTGRDMRAYNSKEQEILFERGTRFLVVKREGNTIWLKEI